MLDNSQSFNASFYIMGDYFSGLVITKVSTLLDFVFNFFFVAIVFRVAPKANIAIQ